MGKNRFLTGLVLSPWRVLGLKTVPLYGSYGEIDPFKAVKVKALVKGDLWGLGGLFPWQPESSQDSGKRDMFARC